MTKISNSNNKKTLKKKLKQIGGSDSINVLTWNICWQAMEGESSGSAPILGTICSTTETNPKTKLNMCTTNVINLIDKLRIDYDFVALQEPAKWKDIFDNSTKLNTMGYVHHSVGSTSELVTFYNKEKYLALGVIADTFDYNSKRGRPYHIIFFKNKITGEFYIFINLHNAHNMPKNDLERQLASNFNKFKNKFKIIEKDKQEHAEQLTATMEIDKNNNYNVIVAGDFNDDGKMNYWQGFKPFKKTNIHILKNLEVKCNVEPPNTCCRQVNSVQPDKSGDYILVNNTLTIEEPNYIPPISNNFFPSSDHMPVLIKLKLKTPVIGVMTRQQARLLQGRSGQIQGPTSDEQQIQGQIQRQGQTQIQEQTQRQGQSTQTQTQRQTQRQAQTQIQRQSRQIQGLSSEEQQTQRQSRQIQEPTSEEQQIPRQASPSEALPTEPIEKTESSIEHTESNSSNMFSAPLMAMIFAIPIIFLLNK